MGANAEFGRRRPLDRSAAAPAAPTAAQPVEDVVAASRAGTFTVAAPWLQRIGGILAGVGIVASMAAGSYFTMRGFGRALDRQWSENAGYPGLEDAYRRSATGDATLEAVHNNCKSRSDFVRLPAGQARALDGPGLDGVYAGEAALAKAAYYLSCLATERPARLCQATHRSHLISALKDYYRLMGRVREERVLATSGPFAATRMSLGGPAPARSGPPTPMPSLMTDQRVVDALRRLIVDGYLTRRDLAPVLGPPGDLELALRGVEPRRAECG